MISGFWKGRKTASRQGLKTCWCSGRGHDPYQDLGSFPQFLRSFGRPFAPGAAAGRGLPGAQRQRSRPRGLPRRGGGEASSAPVRAASARHVEHVEHVDMCRKTRGAPSSKMSCLVGVLNKGHLAKGASQQKHKPTRVWKAGV